MSQSPTTSAATSDVIEDAEPTLVKDGMSDAPVLITPQEVVFSTAAALPPPASTSRRLIDAIRVVGAALRPAPPRRHHPRRNSYLEHSRMAREMDRL
jgi:hypothetical protein